MPMSAEARARLAARNKETQIWKLARNTGAKTPEGRKRISQNALRHGARHSSMKAIAEWVKSVKILIATGCYDNCAIVPKSGRMTVTCAEFP